MIHTIIHRWFLFFLRFGFDLGGSNTTVVSPPADPKPIADASEAAVASSERIANKQMALSQEQIDNANMQHAEDVMVAKPILDAQTANMNQMTAQSKDYNDYTKNTFRPIVSDLTADANNFSAPGAEVQFARTAAADLQEQEANQRAQSERAATSMGINPNSGKFASINRGTEILNAGARAGAVTQGRVQANQMGINKKLTVAGLVSGMPSVSVAASQASTGAGNSAMNTELAPTATYNAGVSAGANTLAQGAGTSQAGYNAQIGGLSSIGSLQNQAYGMGLNYNASSNAGSGQLLGMVGGLAGAALFS